MKDSINGLFFCLSLKNKRIYEKGNVGFVHIFSLSFIKFRPLTEKKKVFSEKILGAS